MKKTAFPMPPGTLPTKLGLVWLCYATSALAQPATSFAGSPPVPSSIRVLEQPSPNQPLVAIRLLFQTGSADDPQGREGVTHLTMALLAEGATQKRTYAQVLDALYPMAATLNSYGDKDTTVFEGTIHRDHLEAYANLLAEQILTPRFLPDDFKRHRQDALDDLTKTLRGNDDESLGKEALGALMYEGHPYAHPALGTVAGLTACTLEDIWQTYRDTFTQDRLIIGLAGGYPADFPRRFAARFSQLKAQGVPRRPLPPARENAGMHLHWVQKKALGTAISMGHPIAVTRVHDDFYPLFLAASYLGEHRTFNGVLMLSMRQKRGLNYGDYAYVENFIQEGFSTFPLPNVARRQQHFEIWIRPVSPANAGFAIRQAVYEMDKLIREGIPAAGFTATRAFLRNYLELWTQDLSRRLGYAMDALLYGRDLQVELRHRLDRMTKADVDRAVRKHLAPQKLSLAVVGENPLPLKDALEKGAATPIRYDSKNMPSEILNEDKVIQVFSLPLAPKAAKILSAKSIFEK